VLERGTRLQTGAKAERRSLSVAMFELLAAVTGAWFVPAYFFP